VAAAMMAEQNMGDFSYVEQLKRAGPKTPKWGFFDRA
jgi:hypothetical protein